MRVELILSVEGFKRKEKKQFLCVSSPTHFRLVNPYNHVSQYIKINISLAFIFLHIYIHTHTHIISSIGSVSVENPV